MNCSRCMHAAALAAIGVHVEVRLAFLPPKTSMEEDMRLKNQVAIVTDAGRNIGEDICKLFVQEGAKDTVVDFVFCINKSVANEINAAHPGKALAVVCDVSSADSVEKMVQRVTQEFGGVDILVNNAAWTDHKTIFDITEEE